MLLGALVRRALRVVGQHRLVEALARVGVKDVVGGGVDEAANAGPLCGSGELPAADGVDLVEDAFVLDPLLGHANRDTTALYARVATNTIRAVMSPLDRIRLLSEDERQPDA